MNGRIDIGRREFIGGIGAFAAASLAGCATDKGAVAVRAKDGDYRAILLHLGYNMWCDAPTEYATELGDFESGRKRAAKTELICDDGIWRRAVDHAAAKGMNMIVIDLGEGVAYPSHPELAVRGTWSVDKLVRELDRIRALGMEPIPKLNFSCQHNGWMKDWRFMVSSRPYHRFCEDLIRDVADIFGHPRFMHLGCDEETSSMQRQRLYACVRRGEIWKQDFPPSRADDGGVRDASVGVGGLRLGQSGLLLVVSEERRHAELVLRRGARRVRSEGQSEAGAHQAAAGLLGTREGRLRPGAVRHELGRLPARPRQGGGG